MVTFCSECVYYAAFGSRGECRRYPPLPMRSPLGDVTAEFPPVHAYNWCGEWREKKG